MASAMSVAPSCATARAASHAQRVLMAGVQAKAEPMILRSTIGAHDPRNFPSRAFRSSKVFPVWGHFDTLGFWLLLKIRPPAAAQGLWKGVLPSLVMVSNPTVNFMLYETLRSRLEDWRRVFAGAAAFPLPLLLCPYWSLPPFMYPYVHHDRSSLLFVPHYTIRGSALQGVAP